MRLEVDLIVSSSTPANQAALQATRTIPIVTTVAAEDPRTGSITSLSRPGGNLTGLTTINIELTGKQLGLLKEALPKTSRVALFRNPGNPIQAAHLPRIDTVARSLRLQIQVVEVRGPDDFETAFKAATRDRADAVFGLPDTMLVVHRTRLTELATKYRLPTMSWTREHPEAGGLMSYGANVPAIFRRAATYVDKILKGAKPSDLPIEQPTKFELVINMKTAKALGLTIPQSLLVRADEIIQ